jgi:hypothetical protein
VVGDEPLIRDIQAGLKNTGLSILDGEAVWLVSCSRFFWTLICPTEGRYGEVQHEQDQTR